MSNHQASEQLVGYLYQVRYALKLLLDHDDSNIQISIEKFDDVAFEKEGRPEELIQLKHHIKKKGSLTDSSIDLWRTLKVWIDLAYECPDIINYSKFIIITTEVASNESATYYLKDNENRNPQKAYKQLKDFCNKSNSKEKQKYFQSFLRADMSTTEKIINNIYVIDGAQNIVDIEKNIRRSLRYTCIPKFEAQVCERIEGWWYKKAIEMLCSDKPVCITQSQLREFIVSVSQEYADDNLPIDDIDISDLQKSYLNTNEKVFCEQLRLICVSSNRMQVALRDYYRAFRQRANWVRSGLLYLKDLDKYEELLIDEWEHAFAVMEDELVEDNEVTDKDKCKAGRELLKNIENKNLYIRPKCQNAFVMRGSYHMLADELKVGWHIDFKERLKNLLVKEGDALE